MIEIWGKILQVYIRLSNLLKRFINLHLMLNKAIALIRTFSSSIERCNTRITLFKNIEIKGCETFRLSYRSIIVRWNKESSNSNLFPYRKRRTSAKFIRVEGGGEGREGLPI